MRLLYVSEEPSRTLVAPSVHTRDLAGALRARGHSVDLEFYQPARGPLFSQAMSNWAFGRSLGKRLRSGAIDAVIQRERLLDPFLSLGCKKRGVRCAMEVNALLVDEFRRDGVRPSSLALARSLQRAGLRAATAVMVNSRARGRRLQADYRLNARGVHWVRMGVRLDEFRPIPLDEARKRSGLPDGLLIGYLGAFSRNYDLRPAMRAVRELRRMFRSLKLVLAGAGPRATALQCLVRELDLDQNVVMIGAVPHEQAALLIASLDLCLLPPSETILRENDGVFYCMKLAEYAACGRPILKHDYPGSESFEALRDCSWSFDLSEPLKARDVIATALASPEERLVKGLAAREYAEAHLSWDRSAARVEAVLAACRRAPGGGP